MDNSKHTLAKSTENRVVNWSASRINRLARELRAHTYLEIGVFKGATFSDVTVPHRWGVDPQFRFDPDPVRNDHTRLFSIPSDDFFSSDEAARTFDIVFLDGHHSFEQAYRDFCNALACSHAKTVILIDDTLPVDVYSALSSQEKAIAARRRAGGVGGAWHGDVYKVVLALHDFHLRLDYRTIVGSGNPQTLVWRDCSKQRKAAFDSMEKIARVSYFELHERVELLRIGSEESSIADCIAALTATPVSLEAEGGD